MQEPHEKGVAIRSAPSFALGAAKCPVKRKQGKRWAGYRASKICNQGADAVPTAEGHTPGSATASCRTALRSRRPHARLETPCTRTGRPRGCLKRTFAKGRRAEGASRTARVHVLEESDSGTVPMNHSNKSGQPPAGSEEGRPLIKENTHQSSTLSTQSETRVSQGLAGVRRAAKERKGMKFTALLHHLTVALLRDGFYALKRKAAPGVDGITWMSTRPGWKIGSPICTAGSTAALIERNHREGCTFRNRMVGNGRSGLRRWSFIRCPSSLSCSRTRL